MEKKKEKTKKDFVYRLIKEDVTWVYQYNPESKQEAKKWREPELGSSAPKRIYV